MPSYEMRTMTRDEVDLAVEWAGIEGWNPGLYDAGTYYATDPGGFFVGLLDGEPIATISAVAYDETYGFVGFYIVKPEYRGRGYGLRLWQHAMAYLGKRNIGLDGVLAQVGNYERSGFKRAYSHVRYGGQTTSEAGASAQKGVEHLSIADLQRIEAYDRPLYPAARRPFLVGWLKLPGSHAFAATRDDRIEGYGVIRECVDGYRIGPLFADKESIAQSLYAALTSAVPSGTTAYLDVPTANPAAIAFAARHNLTQGFECVRMYTQGPPTVDLARIFGATTLELG